MNTNEQPPQNNIGDEEVKKEEESFIPQKTIFEKIKDNWDGFRGLEKEKREQYLNTIQDPEKKDKMTNRFFAFALAEDIINKLDR